MQGVQLLVSSKGPSDSYCFWYCKGCKTCIPSAIGWGKQYGLQQVAIFTLH